MARARDSASNGAPVESLRRTFDLHRRHGEQVVRVLRNALEQYKEQLSKGLMAPGSLLTFVVGEQLEVATGRLPFNPGPHPKSPGIQLIIDVARGQFSVNAQPPLRGKSSVTLLEILAAQHRADTQTGRKPEMFAFTSKERLTRELGIEEHALRRQIERLRDRIDGALATIGVVVSDREIVIQSQQRRGYRLNPAVYLVAPV